MLRYMPRQSIEKVELLMTPMIDIVFQLLIFFIMSFKIAAQEGDFWIRMPLDKPREPAPACVDRLPIRFQLRATPDGSLANINANGSNDFGVDYQKLRQFILRLRDDQQLPSHESIPDEADLICDTNLRYEFVIDVITAISGYKHNGRTVKLIEKINLRTVAR